MQAMDMGLELYQWMSKDHGLCIICVLCLELLMITYDFQGLISICDFVSQTPTPMDMGVQYQLEEGLVFQVVCLCWPTNLKLQASEALHHTPAEWPYSLQPRSMSRIDPGRVHPLKNSLAAADFQTTGNYY